MQIAVEDIHEKGRQVALNADLAWAVSAAGVALEAAPVDFSGDLELTVSRRRVTVQANVTAKAPRECARCGEDVLLEIEVDESLTYRPQPTETGTGEIELKPSELDIGWYGDGVLKLDEVLTELISLAMPVRVVCIDEAACTARVDALLQNNRVEVESTGHPAFAVLKDIH